MSLEYQTDELEARKLSLLELLMRLKTEREQKKYERVTEASTTSGARDSPDKHEEGGPDISAQVLFEVDPDLQVDPETYVYEKELQESESDRAKRKEELQARMKKTQELVASAMSSVSRVAHQLHEDTKITNENVLKRLSSCGLRLEHLLAVLSKAKNVSAVGEGEGATEEMQAEVGIERINFARTRQSETEAVVHDFNRFYAQGKKREEEKDEEVDHLQLEYVRRKDQRKVEGELA